MTPQPWTIEQIDALRAMWAAGKTCEQIGMALHRSRSMIAGKVRRLNLERRTPAHSANIRWANTPRAPKQKTGGFRLTDRTKPHHRRAPSKLAVLEAPGSVPVPLTERTGCCYPTSEESPHLFCNAAVEGERSYCEFHHRIVYVRRGS